MVSPSCLRATPGGLGVAAPGQQPAQLLPVGATRFQGAVLATDVVFDVADAGAVKGTVPGAERRDSLRGEEVGCLCPGIGAHLFLASLDDHATGVVRFFTVFSIRSNC